MSLTTLKSTLSLKTSDDPNEDPFIEDPKKYSITDDPKEVPITGQKNPAKFAELAFQEK